MKSFKKSIAVLLCAVMVLGTLPALTLSVGAVAADDLGFAKDGSVYLIRSTDDWIKLGTVTSFTGSEVFRQECDLNFSGITATAENNYLMLGRAAKFSATYDGNGKKISGMNISAAEYVGPFQYINDATVKNLTVSNSSFITTKDNGYVGGIVGSSVSNNSQSGIINTVANCTVEASVSVSGTASSYRIGGIIGDAGLSSGFRNQKLIISDCTVAANLYGMNGSGGSLFIGGIVGVASNTNLTSYSNEIEIKGCVSTVTIQAKLNGSLYLYVGGIAGELNTNSSLVEDCFSSPTISLTRDVTTSLPTTSGVGGLVGGFNRGKGTSQVATVRSCYADMSLTTSGIGIASGVAVGRITGATANLTNLGYNNTTSLGTRYLGAGSFSQTSGVSASAAPNMTESSISVTLDGGVGMNIYLDVAGLAGGSFFSNVELKAAYPNGRTEILSANESGVISVPVNASEMDQAMTLSLSCTFDSGSGMTPKTMCVSTISYSLADLIRANLKDAANVDVDAELARLISTMQQYGDAAKAYFAGETVSDNAALESVTNDLLLPFAAQVSGSDAGLTYRGSSLVLESKTNVRHYFKLANGKSVSDFAFAVNGKSVTPKAKDGGWYYVEISEVSAQDLDLVYTVTLGGLTLSYSALSYCNAVLQGQSADAALINTVRSLYLYNRAAEIYVTPHETARSGWLLSAIPAYEGGTLSKNLYDCGSMVTDVAGESISKMQLVSGTNATQFDAYVSKLKGYGFAVESDETIESNRYVSLFNGAQRVYTYYTAYDASVRVIWNSNSVSAKEMSGNGNATEGATFYLYGLNRDPGGHNASYDTAEKDLNRSGLTNAGLLLVIKCADNSVIIVDGGSSGQMSTEYLKRYDAFLHEITNTPENEKVTISCWYMTHGDGDHTQGFYRLLTNYAHRYDLQRICTNFPAYTSSSTITAIGALVNTHYPNCKEIKIHTGQSIQISDVTLQALYTHEDNVNPTTGAAKISDNNNASLVMRVSTKDMSMLVTGDINNSAGLILTKNFTNATLGCDIIQVAHHSFNKLTTLYDAVSAPIAIFPQSEYGSQKDYPFDPVTFLRDILAIIKNANPNGVACYYDAYYYDEATGKTVDPADVDPLDPPAKYQTSTWGFSVVDGKVVPTVHETHVFDNSP